MSENRCRKKDGTYRTADFLSDAELQSHPPQNLHSGSFSPICDSATPRNAAPNRWYESAGHSHRATIPTAAQLDRLETPAHASANIRRSGGNPSGSARPATNVKPHPADRARAPEH